MKTLDHQRCGYGSVLGTGTGTGALVEFSVLSRVPAFGCHVATWLEMADVVVVHDSDSETETEIEVTSDTEIEVELVEPVDAVRVRAARRHALRVRADYVTRQIERSRRVGQGEGVELRRVRCFIKKFRPQLHRTQRPHRQGRSINIGGLRYTASDSINAACLDYVALLERRFADVL